MEKGDFKLLLKGLLVFIIVIIIIFISAGRINYWQGWVYIIISFIFILITVLIVPTELARERLKPGPGIKWWDRLYSIISMLLGFTAVVIGSLDVGRFNWSVELSIHFYILSVIIYCLGQSIFLWAKYKNKFFATVVRIQTERGHQVCQDGPYRFVRHPGYVGGILFEITTPLILGSLWALIPQLIAAILLIVRTYLEDITLQKELPGYNDYSKKVKYKLFPGVW